jgi:aquaporin Z
MLIRAYLAEFLAALLVVYVILETGNSLAIGATYALTRILATPLSGGHINPMVSIALASGDYFPYMEVVPYVIAQICGAVLAVHIFKNFKL